MIARLLRTHAVALRSSLLPSLTAPDFAATELAMVAAPVEAFAATGAADAVAVPERA